MGAISLDISATQRSLARYCAILAAGFVTATITLKGQRAENVLSSLTGTAALIAAELIGYDPGYLRLPMIIAVIGFILSCATAIRTYEHLDSTQYRKS